MKTCFQNFIKVRFYQRSKSGQTKNKTLATSETKIDISFIDYEWRLEKKINNLTLQIQAYPLSQNLQQTIDHICPYASLELVKCIQTFFDIEKDKFYLK